jgi:hypothetical protein
LRLTPGGETAGFVSLGLANAADQEDPRVLLEYVKVEEAFQGTGLGLQLACEINSRWPLARIRGGPVSQDDDPGPRFRLRCWDEIGVQIHEPFCRLERCDCRGRMVSETAERYQQMFNKGRLSASGLEEKLMALKLPQQE